MKNTTIRKMQVLALAVAMASATPALLAQQKQQPNQQSNPAQAQAAPAAAQNSACGNQPLCYDTADFAATITQFRVSVDASGTKILDAIMHFQNKTNQLLSLDYVEGSGSGLDDQGNRYGLNSAYNGVRGIGVVAGNKMDPKFTLQPGGGGDVRFEWMFRPGQGVVVGVNYELELSIREINRMEGNQWVLGGETLLHYQGLANGVGVAPGSFAGSTGMAPASSGGAAVTGTGSAFVPGQTAASVSSTQPCPPGTTARITNVANAAGQQNATANTAVSNATSAVTSLGSLFGHKKAAAAPATTNTASAAPCVATPAAATKAATTQQTPTGVTKASLKQAVPATNSAKTPAPAAPAAPGK